MTYPVVGLLQLKITQKSIMLNKDENNQVPYYGRRHFRYASTGDAKGHIFLE